MKTGNDLFILIKSLDRNEKRYFHLFASRHIIGNESKYLNFFDVIARQKEYDEDKIKEIFRQGHLGKNLAADKNRLYNLVLESLSDFHSKISIEAKLRQHIQQAEVLFEKGLYDQVNKIIRKSKKIAVGNDYYLYLLELQRLEKKVISMNQSPSDIQNHIEGIYKEAFHWNSRYKTFLVVEQAYHRMLGFQKIHGYGRKKSELLHLGKLVKTLKHKIDETNLDTLQKKYYFIMLSVYYRIIGNLEQSYEYSIKQQALYREDVANSNEMYNYISFLNNLSISQIELFKYKEALETIYKIRRLGDLPVSKRSSRMQTLVFTSFLSELSVLSGKGEFSKGVSVIKAAQKDLEHYSTKMGAHLIVFRMMFAIIYFGAGDYKKSMMWLNKIIHQPDQNVRLDLHSLARVMGLIVHYELHNEVLLPYYVKSVYRYLLKKQRLFKLEIYILEFIRKKTPKINSAKDLKLALQELKEKLLPLKKDEFEKVILQDFDLISWLESKIEKRSFEDIVKEKAGV